MASATEGPAAGSFPEQEEHSSSLSIEFSKLDDQQNPLLDREAEEEEQKLVLQQGEGEEVGFSGISRWKGGYRRWHSFLGAACSVAAVTGLFFLIGLFIYGSVTREGLSSGTEWGFARTLQKLDKPLVILVSSDGFRFGYNWKAATPNIDRLRAEGTEAEPGMIPVFPTKTFPNHYSMATGLYPAYHGIIGNWFRDPDNPTSNDTFFQGNLDPKWWLGEPIWETVVNQGLQAATYFWPGSQVKKGNWTCEPEVCHQYNSSVPYEERVDTVLGWVDLPAGKRPSLITLYFEAPDEPGHVTGPDAPQITSAVVRIDDMMGRLFAGLTARGVLDDVTVIMVGDHGMVGNCDDKMIYLEDLGSDVQIPTHWVDSYSPVLAIRPPPEVDVSILHRNISKALAAGNVNNAEFLEVYLKEQLPPRLHYSESPRIQPIIGLLGEGYTLAPGRANKMHCGGNHGYDNAFLSMRTIFIASGPQFAKGRRISSFENVELYKLMTSILGLTPAANNATSNFVDSLLLPDR